MRSIYSLRNNNSDFAIEAYSKPGRMEMEQYLAHTHSTHTHTQRRTDFKTYNVLESLQREREKNKISCEVALVGRAVDSNADCVVVVSI